MKTVPNILFQTRIRDDSIGGDNPYRWQPMSTDDYFKGKRVVVFSLPGAFTPTCSTFQLPDYEKLYDEFKAQGIDEIYCISVNDSFVMNKWAQQVVDGGLKKVKVIPDGSGRFTRQMGMLVDKDNLGFGMRSWRYAMVVNDGVVEALWEEPGRADNHESDPYGESSPQTVLERIKYNVI
jgi:thioredoxin-dependent peroxiredoxin